MIDTNLGTNHTYIGDGVYASFDGYQIWLQAERNYMTHQIALEQPAMIQLLNYATQVGMLVPIKTEELTHD